jgi:hypothetical protein
MQNEELTNYKIRLMTLEDLNIEQFGLAETFLYPHSQPRTS